MFPRYPTNDAANGHLPNAIIACELILIGFVRLVPAANLVYLFGGKFGIAVFLAGACALRVSTHSVSLAARRASLFFHVVGVYLMRSKKEMRSVYTKLVIARMADKLTARVGLVLDKVRDAVRTVIYLTFSESPVAARHSALRQPRPASIRVVDGDLRPKAGNVLQGKNGKLTILNRHDVTSGVGCFVLGPRECFEHLRGLLILPQVAP